METFLRDLLLALVRRGVCVSALVHRGTSGFASRADTLQGADGSIEVMRAAVWARVMYTPLSPAFPWLLSRMLRRFRPRVLHVHMPCPSAFCLLFLPAARRLPWVVHWHADAIDDSAGRIYRWVYHWLYSPLQSAMLKSARAVLVTSQPYLESSPALRPYRDKCVVIPLGLDPVHLHAAVDSEGPRDSPRHAFSLLSVGRLTYYKGLEVLLQAVAGVPGVRLRVVGQGDEMERLGRIARELAIADRVEFLGAVDSAELARRYRECDCFCLPSTHRSEAFGLVLLEAMSFGKPVIASDIPGSGVGWVVREGENGLKVKPGDVPQWSQAITRLARDEALCRRLGEGGREDFNRRFHIDSCASAVAEVYEQLLEAQ